MTINMVIIEIQVVHLLRVHQDRVFNLFLMWDQEEENVTGTNDLEHYILDRVIYRQKERANLDILEWWCVNLTTFHVVSVMMKDLLIKHISSVAMESMFNTSGQIINKNWNRLALNVAKVVMYLDNWFNQEERVSQLCQQRMLFQILLNFSINGNN